MKMDLVMWTKNGERTLASVLNRINYVIPSESVGQCLIIDDASQDKTVQIAKAHGWNVIANEGSGISDGANTALKYVKTDFFASFEQDVLLTWAWWTNIAPLLKEEEVAVASGVRLPSLSKSLLKINEHSLEKARSLGFPYFKTLDNTIYKTTVIRGLGGFPRTRMIIDTVLAKQIKDAGFKWVVDYETVSIHLKTLLDEVKSQYFYGCMDKKNNFLEDLARTAYSPFRGVEVAWKKKCWQAAFVYPMLRISHFLGVLRGMF